ncbi:hypothetical protein BDR07DRAFT_433947 [Suillus spraguei]|nr:hypothetical protein BDR07DRAFT_433947 [Suillus spraguei]
MGYRECIISYTSGHLSTTPSLRSLRQHHAYQVNPKTCTRRYIATQSCMVKQNRDGVTQDRQGVDQCKRERSSHEAQRFVYVLTPLFSSTRFPPFCLLSTDDSNGSPGGIPWACSFQSILPLEEGSSHG